MEAVNKQDIIKGDPFGEIAEEIKKALVIQEKFDQKIRDTAKSFETLNDSAKKTVQGIEAVEVAEKRSAKLVQEKIQSTKTIEKLRLEEIRINKAREKSIDDYNKKAAKEEQIAKKNANAYNQQSKQLNDLRHAYKNLAAQNKENTKEAKVLLAQITPLDAKLKAIDKTVGQSQRNVGNYGSALDNLKGKFGSLIGLASQFGLALGGVALVRGFVDTFKEYETAVQSFRTIVSDLSDKDFAKFEGKISDVANTTKRSTIEIAESFENIAGLNADFAKTADGLGLVSEAASTLSKASKDELGASTENLVGIMNQFDLSANEANRTINVLAAGQAVGASTITQSAEAYKNFGTVAKTSNITLEESQALIQTLGKFSLFGAEAGTKLRGVTLQLQKANIGYASGQFDINDALVEFKANLDKKASASEKDAYATKIFGAENITAGKILSNNIGLIDQFTKGVTGTEEAQKAAAINSDTLSNRWTELKNTVTNLITTNNGVSSSFDGIKDALGFISNNLPLIISLVGKLVIAFVSYKAVMTALNLKEQYNNWKNLGKGIEGATDGLEKGAEGGKKFGAALKGIGFAFVISALIEIGTAFYDIASGADDAARAVEGMNKAMAAGGKFASKRLKDLQDNLGLEKITKQQYEDQIKAEIRLMNAEKARTKEQIKSLESSKKYKDALATNPLFRSGADLRVLAQMKAMKESVYSVNEELTVFNDELKSLEIAKIAGKKTPKDPTLPDGIDHEDLDKKTKRLEQYKVALIELDEVQRNLFDPSEVERVLLLDEQRAVLGSEIAVIEAEIALKKAEQTGNTNEILKAEQALNDVKIAQIKAQLQLNLAQTDNVNEREKLIKQSELDILNLDSAKVKEKSNEVLNVFEEFQKGLTDILTEQIDARIDQLKKEEDAAKSQQDYLQELAANGNIIAKQSITDTIAFQRESQAEQARLERAKQQIQLISSGLSTFNKEINDGKKPGEALISTGFVMQTLIGLLKNVQFFAKGTDNAPEGLAVVDEKGAEIITDKKGRIKEIGTGKGARFTHLSKGDKVLTASKTANVLSQFGNIQNGQTMDKRIDTAGNSYDLMMLSELKIMNQNIKNSGSNVHTEWGGIFNGVGEIVERKMKNGNIVTNRYRMKS